MKKKDWPYKILLLVLDLAILTYIYIVPEAHEDGMTTLVLSFFAIGDKCHYVHYHGRPQKQEMEFHLPAKRIYSNLCHQFLCRLLQKS